MHHGCVFVGHLVYAQATLEEGPSIWSRRSVALHPQAVSPATAISLATEEMVHANLIGVANGREGANVPSDTPATLVGVTHHDGGIPADDVGDALFESVITWVLCLG